MTVFIKVKIANLKELTNVIPLKLSNEVNINKDKIKILPKEYFYALSWTQDHVGDSLRNIRNLEKSNSLGSEYKQNNFYSKTIVLV